MQVNDVRLRDGTELGKGGGGALFSLECLEILSYFSDCIPRPPAVLSFLYKSRVTFSAVATIHFESYTFIFDFATTTHTQTRARLFVPAEPTVLLLLLPLLPLQKPITV